VGGANTPGKANALGQIIDYGWSVYNDLNQFSIGFPTFKRDESRIGRAVATEHTMYSTTRALWEVGKDRGLTDEDKDGDSWDDSFVEYTFKDDASESQRGKSEIIDVDFWTSQPNYSVEWTYDPVTNLYMRSNGGAKHIDNNTKKQLSTKNLVILYMSENRANDGYEGNLHMLYGTKGSGDAVVFQDGKQIKGEWTKEDRESRTILTDAAGKKISFNRGLIWFQVVPDDSPISVH
jgi:hypothetical protein